MAPTSRQYSQGPEVRRQQPLFWMVGATWSFEWVTTSFCSGTAKSPIDFKAANRLTEQIKHILGDDLEKVLDGRDVGDLRNRLFNIELANPEADRLKRQLRDVLLRSVDPRTQEERARPYPTAV